MTRTLTDKLEAETDILVLDAMREAVIGRGQWSDDLQSTYALRRVELQRGR